MHSNLKVFIVGPRASGKTIVGSSLGAAIDLKWADTDDHIRSSSGMTVEEIVSRDGWDGFRDFESKSLREVSETHGVISTGGGMVLSEKNRKFMKSRGTVFFLNAPVDILVARLQADPNHALRPSLTGQSMFDEVGDIVKARMPLYTDAAHHVVDASLPLEEILNILTTLLKK